MAFRLVYLSQNDPQWRTDRLGFGDAGDTIGKFGCALTSIAMLLSGHGYAETPKSLNQKMQAKQGFINSLIRWDVVSQVHPQVILRRVVDCRDSEAPLRDIDAALAAGQPVVVLVDNDRDPDLDWHYVMLYAHRDNDYLMLDPWPYQPGIEKEDFLMKRYGYDRPLKRAIRQVLFYEVSGSGGSISTPVSTSQPGTVPSSGSGVYARVLDSVTWGLNIRSSTDTSSMANVIVSVPAGTQLMLLDAGDVSKIGQSNRWVRVREPGGKEGLAAAWFLERVAATTPSPVVESPSNPVVETPASIPTSSTSAPATPTSSAPSPEPSTSTSTPSTPPAKPEPVKFQVIVKTNGAKVYSTAAASSSVLSTEKSGARLTVIESAETAKAKIGVKGKRINVKASNNKRGYVNGDAVKPA